MALGPYVVDFLPSNYLAFESYLSDAQIARRTLTSSAYVEFYAGSMQYL